MPDGDRGSLLASAGFSQPPLALSCEVTREVMVPPREVTRLTAQAPRDAILAPEKGLAMQRADGNCAGSRQGRGSHRRLCTYPSGGIFLLCPPSRISFPCGGKRSSKAFRCPGPGARSAMKPATSAFAQSPSLAGCALSRLSIASRQSIGLQLGFLPGLANAVVQQVPGLAVDRVAQLPSHWNLTPVCARSRGNAVV